MTEAEKAAAAKAEAEAKAKAKAEADAKKAEEEQADDEEDPPDDEGESSKKSETISRSEFESFKKKANKEAEKHRLAAKAKAEELEGYKATIAAALGLKPGDGAKGASSGEVEAAKKAADARVKNAILKSEVVSRAARSGAADAADVFSLMRTELADLEVDLENESVDGEALDEKIAEFKKRKPHLFSSSSSSEGDEKDGETGAEKKKPAKMPDGNGRPPARGGTAYQQWQTLVKGGRQQEANQFYAKNKKDIAATWPK